MPAYAIPSGMSSPATAIPAITSPPLVFQEHVGSQLTIGTNRDIDDRSGIAVPAACHQATTKHKHRRRLPSQPKAGLQGRPLLLLLVADASPPIVPLLRVVPGSLWRIHPPELSSRKMHCRFCQYADPSTVASLCWRCARGASPLRSQPGLQCWKQASICSNRNPARAIAPDPQLRGRTRCVPLN
jgi:hypothetical protein